MCIRDRPHSELSVTATPTSGPTNGRRYGGPVWEWFDHPIGPIDSACLPKRIPGRLLDSRNLRQRSGGAGIGGNSLVATRMRPMWNPVVWRVSLYRAPFDFAPPPQPGLRIPYHSVGPFRRPDSAATCHTFGPFFRSKFFPQSLPRWPVRRGFAAFTAGEALGRSATSHTVTGKYRSPYRTASDPSSRFSTRTLALRNPLMIAARSI